MARNRVIYQSEALYTSKNAASTATGDHRQLHRVQSANFNYTINRQDINQFGELARIDSVVLDPPTVSTDFSYYLTDGMNERLLGFFVQNPSTTQGDAGRGNFASGHMIGSSGKNMFIITSPEGKDINLEGFQPLQDTAIGIGNCYVSNYSVDMAVGSIPTASVSMEGANVNSDLVTTGVQDHDGSDVPVSGGIVDSPAVKQSDGTSWGLQSHLPAPRTGDNNAGGNITALRPGDITLNIAEFDGQTIADISGDGEAHVQSASISVPLSRSPISKLGSRFPFAREVDFPVTVSMSVSAVMNEETAFNLVDKLVAEEKNARITLKDKDSNNAVIWDLRGAIVDTESISSSIGSNKTVDITFSSQIGGPNDINHGLYMSGANSGHAF